MPSSSIRWCSGTSSPASSWAGPTMGGVLRLHLERLEEVTGQRIDSIRAVGGGARSPSWIGIVTDITQRPVWVCADREVHASSAVALPALPLGLEVLPDLSTAAGYDSLFGVYRRMYPALRELFPDLAAAAGLIRGA